MNQLVTRRRFVQALGAGAALVASGSAASSSLASSSVATKIVAQSTDPIVLGIQPGPVPTTNNVPEVGQIEFDSAGSPKTGSLPMPVVVQALNVTTGQVYTVSTPQNLPDGTPILRSNEALTGLTSLADGTIVASISPTVGSENEVAPTRLVFLRTPPRVLTVSGLKSNEHLESLLVAKQLNGWLIGLVMKKNGAPPAAIMAVDLVTGASRLFSLARLPTDRRFRTVTECPDGTVYMIVAEKGGDTTLVRLDLRQQAPIDIVRLHVNGIAWNNGLESLVCDGSGQLLGFGAPRYVTPNALYSINTGSGAMTKLRDFDMALATLRNPATSLPAVASIVAGPASFSTTDSGWNFWDLCKLPLTRA